MKLNRFEIINRCLYWKEKEVLIAGDLHLGYENVLNKEGINIPQTQLKESLDEFKKIFEKVGKVKKIILLGDVKHYFSGILNQEWDDFRKMIYLFNLNLKDNGKIIMIRGDHDKIIEPIVKRFDNVIIKDDYSIGDVLFLHGDFFEFKKVGAIINKKIKLIVIGHFHPAIVLEDGIKREKYKCFLYGKIKELKKELIILPSFFPLIEGSDINKEIKWKFDISNFSIFALDNKGNTYDFGKVSKIKRM